MAAQTQTKTTTPVTPEKARRGRRAGTPNRKIDTDISLDVIQAPVAATPVIQAMVAPQRERSQAQRAMDKFLPTVHKAWQDAGKPSAWNKLPVATYYVAPEKAEGLKVLIRRSADYLGVRARFGTAARVTREYIAAVRKAGGQLEDDKLGLEIVSFAVMDKRERTSK